ncbi:MAG: hypothetical protein AAB074_12000 [Planctomycetota bacterium]
MAEEASGVEFTRIPRSKVAAAGSGSTVALDLLARWYRPVVVKLVTWHLSAATRVNYDPEVVTQEFFIHLLENRSDVFGAGIPRRAASGPGCAPASGPGSTTRAAPEGETGRPAALTGRFLFTNAHSGPGDSPETARP